MSDDVCCPGIVKKITEHVAEVSVLSGSACAGCHANHQCPSSEKVNKTIYAGVPDAGIAVGDKVMVMMHQSKGYLAVFLSYIIPSALLTGGLFGCHLSGLNDGMSALSALLLTAGYFVILWTFRGRLRRTFVFRIQQIAENQP